MAEATIDTFTDADGVEITYRRWLPDAGDPRATVQIAHGASEHAGRYDRFAQALTDAGYAVFANDHRGHGLTSKATGVGQAGPRGWEGMIDDLGELATLARKEVGGDKKLVLLGHSMGSFLAQLFAQRRGDELDGLVLSGSSGGMAGVTDIIAMLEQMPADEPAALFGPLNATFEPARTPFDWLSRDEAEVDKYIADPYCGDSHPLTIGFVTDMLKHNASAWEAENEQGIPADLPVLFITGEADPVSDGATSIRDLEARYRANGIKDVTAHYYAGARHELLNETNRDDVTRDVIRWLDRVTR